MTLRLEDVDAVEHERDAEIEIWFNPGDDPVQPFIGERWQS